MDSNTSKNLTKKIIALTRVAFAEIDQLKAEKRNVDARLCDARWAEEVEEACREAFDRTERVLAATKQALRDLGESLKDEVRGVGA